MKPATRQRVGQIVSVVLFLVAFGLQTGPEQVASNVSGWISFFDFGPISVPAWVANFTSNWRDFIVGFTLASALFFWFGSHIIYPSVSGRIAPTFVSLFGRYTLGPVNVYELNSAGDPVGRTINLTAERDRLVTVKTIIPWLLYRVVPKDNDRLMVVLLKRFPRDQTCTIHFGVLG